MVVNLHAGGVVEERRMRVPTVLQLRKELAGVVAFKLDSVS